MSAKEALERQLEILSDKSKNASASELADLTIAIVNVSIELRRLTNKEGCAG